MEEIKLQLLADIKEYIGFTDKYLYCCRCDKKQSELLVSEAMPVSDKEHILLAKNQICLSSWLPKAYDIDNQFFWGLSRTEYEPLYLGLSADHCRC